MGPAGPAIDGPAEKLVNELQQSRKMQMIDHLQAKLLEDQRRSLKHFECVQSGLSIMRAGAMRSRPQTSPAGGIVKQTAQELGLQRLSFTETLRQEVEASRVSCGIRGSVELPSHVPMAQIPEQPELERPKTSPAAPVTAPPTAAAPASPAPTSPSAKSDGAGQSLSLNKSLKTMKTAGTVKFRGSGSGGGSGPLGVSWNDEEEEFCRFHEEYLFPLDHEDFNLADAQLYRAKGSSLLLSQSSNVMTFAFGGAEGTRLATADSEGSLAIWNVLDRTRLWSESIGSCAAMVFSSSGKLFAAADRAGRVHFWQLGGSSSKPSVESNGSFHVHGEVLALAFSMEKGLAVATSDKVVLLAVPVLQEVATLPQSGDIQELCFSPDGAFMVVSGVNVDARSSLLAEEGDLSAGVVFWEVSGAFKRLGSMIFQQMIRVTTFRPDGRYLAVAGDNKLISLVDVLNDFDHEGDLPCSHTVRALAWSPNLRCLASGGEDHLVTVWDLASKHILFQMEPMKDWIVRLAWSSHGLLAYTHAGAQGVRLAPLEEVAPAPKEMPMERSQELEEEPEVPAFVFSVRLPSSTGAPVAKEPSSEEGFRLHVAKDRVDVPASSMKLDMSHPGLVFAQQEPNFVMGHHLTACSFMPHGLSLMVAGEEVFEWEVEGKTKLREIHLRDAANVLATSPCGGYVAVANATTVTVHRLMSKGQEAVLNRKVTSNIVALGFSSRHFLAVGTIEKKVLVFHLEDSKEPEVLVAQVNDLCFAPSGDILAIPGGDDEVGQVLLWRVEREACMYLGTVATRGVALCARFDETGDILAVGCDDDRIVLLLPEHSFKCWTELRSSFSVARLAFAGNFLCAAGDREAAIFNLSNSQLVLQVPRQEEKIKDISLTGDGCLACCFRGHVTLLRLENAPQVPSGRAVMQVPSDKDRFKSRGTVTSLSLKSSPSEVMHSVQLNFGHVEAAQEGLQVSRSMRSTGSCSNLELGGEDSSARLEARRSLSKSKSLPSDTKVGEGSVDESAYIPIHPGEGDLLQQPPWLLKPRISVTDTSQGGGSRCTTPGEKDEDPEAAALRKRMLLARDLGLDPAIQSKIQITKRPEGVPIKLKHADEVCSLSFFGSSLVAGGYDQHLALWDVEGLTRTTDVHLESEIVCVSFSPCGEYVYCGDADRQLNVFKAKTLELLGSEVIKEQFGCLAGISTPTTLLAVGSTAVVKIFTVPRLEEVASLQHGGQVHSLSFAPSLGMLAAAGGMDLTDGLLDYSAKENRNMKAMVWKSTELAGLWDEVKTVNLQDFCHTAAFSPSGQCLALAGEDRTISILSVGKKFEKVEELLCGAGIRTLAWTRNSRLLASAGEDMRVSVWDVLFKRVVLHLPKAEDWLCGLAFSMDSRWLATCGYGQEAVDLWPIEVEDCEFSW